MSEFNDYAERVKNLKTKPSNDDMLKLYGLFKQATVGPNTTTRPGFLDMTGKAKWDAWEAVKEVTKEDAEEQYVEHAKSLISSIGLKE